MPTAKSLDYKTAGVSLEAADELVARIKPLVGKTQNKNVLAGIGGFGASYRLGQYKDPILVSGTDGAGTKVKLACQWQQHTTIGQDLVAMSVNDILVQAATPLFFLDYFACGHLDVGVATQVISGVADGCALADCALVGGETAEMPDLYAAGEYDLAGFAVGVVEREAMVTGAHISPGDVVLGLASSGAHANGYSLIRRILKNWGGDPLTYKIRGLDASLASMLMMPTRIYVKPVLAVLKEIAVKGMAHITGGGLPGNIPRILPERTRVVLSRKSWPSSPLFDWLQEYGQVKPQEMLRVFNCGLGYVLILKASDAQAAMNILQAQGQQAWQVGVVERQKEESPSAVIDH